MVIRTILWPSHPGSRDRVASCQEAAEAGSAAAPEQAWGQPREHPPDLVRIASDREPDLTGAQRANPEVFHLGDAGLPAVPGYQIFLVAQAGAGTGLDGGAAEPLQILDQQPARDAAQDALVVGVAHGKCPDTEVRMLIAQPPP